MRVLLVTPYFPEQGGGVEIAAGQLAARLAARAVDVRWMASATVSRAADGVPGIVRIPVPTWDGIQQATGIPYPIWSPSAVARMATEIRRADVVHIHDTLCVGSVAAAALARASRTPLLVTQHIGPRPYRQAVHRALMRAAVWALSRTILATAGQAVFISRAVVEFFRTVPYRRAPLFIPNGVDSARFRPPTDTERRAARDQLSLPPTRPVALFVGRYVETKGLRVMRGLAERCPDVTWLFVGRGPLDPAGWGLPHVRSDGQVPHEALGAYYHAADVLLLPSTGEGFPLVVQEAMASGLPVVLPPETVAAIPDVGALTLVADPTPDAMTPLLRAALADPVGRGRLAASAAQFAATHFNWESCADRYLTVFKQLSG